MDILHCPFCKRNPSQIIEYREKAKELKMSAEAYVRMDEGTYDKSTNLFCCTSCYVNIGLPTNDELHFSFNNYRGKVIQSNVSL